MRRRRWSTSTIFLTTLIAGFCSATTTLSANEDMSEMEGSSGSENEDDDRSSAMLDIDWSPSAVKQFNSKAYLEQLATLEKQTAARSRTETLQLLQRLHNTCRTLHLLDPEPADHCPYFYDSFSCWRPTPVGTWSRKECPKYILGMDTPYNSSASIAVYCRRVQKANATGIYYEAEWDYALGNKSQFLDLYGACFEHRTPNVTSNSNTTPLHAKLSEILRKTQMVGPVCYSISFVALLIASLIFICFRRLHCSRNFIHLHLFMAFMIRAAMCLLQYYLFNNGQTMTLDGEITEQDGMPTFVQPGAHWECKLLITLWNYSLIASYFWLLVEGLYLHNVIYFFVFREVGIIAYVIFGWFAPVLVIVPWIVVKAVIENHLCWVAYLDLNYFWILRGPIMATICINFFLFLNMIRELFMKLRDSHITETRKYRKLAKSSLLLIVLLGIYYFIISIPMLILDTDHLTWPLLICLSVEHIFGSLQGLMVALAYCFLNSEVRGVLKKRYYLWKEMREMAAGSNGTNGCAQRALIQRPSRDSRRRSSGFLRRYYAPVMNGGGGAGGGGGGAGGGGGGDGNNRRSSSSTATTLVSCEMVSRRSCGSGSFWTSPSSRDGHVPAVGGAATHPSPTSPLAVRAASAANCSPDIVSGVAHRVRMFRLGSQTPAVYSYIHRPSYSTGDEDSEICVPLRRSAIGLTIVEYTRDRYDTHIDRNGDGRLGSLLERRWDGSCL